MQWKKNIYIQFLGKVIQNVEDRFPDLPILQNFEVFNTIKIAINDSHGHGDEKISVSQRLR